MYLQRKIWTATKLANEQMPNRLRSYLLSPSDTWIIANKHKLISCVFQFFYHFVDIVLSQLKPYFLIVHVGIYMNNSDRNRFCYLLVLEAETKIDGYIE